MPWELSSPVGLALLGLLAPLVLLYVLKVRRERRVVASTWLWQAAARDLQAKSPFRRLIPNVPLLLELAAIALLALALADPIARTGRIAARRIVLVVDVSASMGAVESGATRLAQGVRAARELLERSSPGTEVLVLAAGRNAELVSPFERDQRRLRAALDRLEVQEAEGILAPAVAMAAEQLRGRGDGRIVVVTDAAVTDADALVKPNVPVDVIRVPASRGNTGIVRTEVVRAPDPLSGRDRVEVFALLSHDSDSPRDVFVTLTQRNVAEPLASRQVRLAPGERSPVVLGFDIAPTDAGTGLTVQLSPPDLLSSDDRTNVRVPLGTKLTVVLAPRKASVWLERALSSDADIELYKTELDGLTPENVPEDALVVLDGACPERMPGGDVLIVNAPEGPCRSARLGPFQSGERATSWADTDPRLRFLTFDGVEIARSRTVTVDRPADALVRTRTGTLIADVSSPGRTGTLVAFDIGESNWPLKASFVLFVRNVVELARAHRAASFSAPLRTGEPVSLRVPSDVESVQVEDAAGRRSAIATRAGMAVLPAPLKVGFVHVSWQGRRPGSTLVPTALTSDAESHVGARPLPFAGGSTQPPSKEAGVSRLSWILALLALALIVLDVVWTTRRPALVTT